MFKRLAVVLLAGGVLVAGCSHPSQTTYQGSEAGRIQNTQQATIVSAREVEIKGGENSGLGAAAGAASAGTVANAATKGNKRLPATVIGALAGAGLGYLIEEGARSRQGFEYVLRMPDGRLVTLVQNKTANEAAIPAGQEVLIQQGRDFTRIVALPEGTGPAEIQTQGPDHNGLDGGRGVAPVSRTQPQSQPETRTQSSARPDDNRPDDADSTGETASAPKYPDATWSDPDPRQP